jgi:hypothetical protein
MPGRNYCRLFRGWVKRRFRRDRLRIQVRSELCAYVDYATCKYVLHAFEGRNDGGRRWSRGGNVVLREECIHVFLRQETFPQSLRLLTVVRDEVTKSPPCCDQVLV